MRQVPKREFCKEWRARIEGVLAGRESPAWRSA